MIEADIGSRTELLLRFFVVGFTALFLIIATEQRAIALWLIIFLLTNGYYSWRLSKVATPVSAQTYLGLQALFMLSVALYTSCAVYIFLVGTPSFVTTALAALTAQALFNISRHRQSDVLAIFDTAVVALAGLFFGLSSLWKVDGNLSEQMIIVIATLGVCSYYVIAQIRKIQIHNALQTSRQEAVQTQKMRAVGQLTAGVAHEFNNLLTVIRGNIELAQLSEGTSESQARLNDAIKAADRADALTSQLLSLSRKARLEAASINLDQFWRDFATIVPRITSAQIRVHLEPQSEPETLYCDVNQLEVALINLIINARDAMDERGEVWVGCRQATPADLSHLGLDKDGAFGIITVRDNGPGIPKHLLPKVVEPFFTTKDVGQGTGLGLPMVKGFCEQSGGGFAIVSDPSGTLVLLGLPVLSS
ncbi:sensor histidine kinase [Cognatiyoonia sp. IB215182]|uniref:sensor histidine kinase n=1 Tax=Cognatiyoonia sp. IB215182 TaxID=3097353 RepID=UPI002A17FC3E|nr:ATP-binding protein [Cognatiyoonia sp. IB215182]MDX8355069.1 ATP-binding protein [Cognatiyoonia sp. IB215182]